MKKSDPRKISKKKEEKRRVAISRAKALERVRVEDRKAAKHERVVRTRHKPITREDEQRHLQEQAMPIDPDKVFAPPVETKLTREEAIAKLHHNLEILKALEEQYNKEQEERRRNNVQLEGEGVTDLKAKVAAMQEKMTEFRPSI